MEALVAFGLAANIVPFLEFTARFASKGWQVYRSHERGGDIEEVSNVESAKALTSDLKKILSNLHGCQEGDPARSSDMNGLVQDCTKVANKLLRNLLELGKLDTSRRRDALKLALATFWKKDALRELEDRLNVFRQQLSLHLLASLREYASRSEREQAKALNKLEAITQEVANLQTVLAPLIASGQPLGRPILQYVSSKLDEDSVFATKIELDIIDSICREDEDGRPRHIPEAYVAETRRREVQRLILQEIRFHSINERENQIPQAHSDTFRWVFETQPRVPNKSSQFVTWLQSTEPLYWITGKPGSGKSTLMKFIGQHKRARDDRLLFETYLSSWANGFPVTVASFYAWWAGSELQITQDGLFRTLLYQLLSRRRELIPVLLPSLWEALWFFGQAPDQLWNMDYQDLLKDTITELTTSSKIFFLIDGLDEFHGNPEELGNLVLELCQLPHVKLCVSSRPWIEFEGAFGGSPSLIVQDLTYPDIKTYITAKFRESHGFSRLLVREMKYANQLIEDIVEKSSGVFLWVALVVKSLLTGLMNEDRTIDLQRRLDELPEDLDKLFERIITKIDPFYLEHANQYFDIVDMHQNRGPLSAIIFSLIDEKYPDFVLAQAIEPFSASTISTRLDTMERRINSRCRGLLEIYTSDDGVETVVYLHRTVAEYIKSPQARRILCREAFQTRDISGSICAGYLASLKGTSDSNLVGRAFSTTISKILFFAKQARGGNKDFLIKVLDELDRTGKCLAKRAASLDYLAAGKHGATRLLLESGTWVLNDPPSFNLERIGMSGLEDQTVFGRTFLSLIAQHGIPNYLSFRANRACLVERVGVYRSSRRGVRSIIWSLLLDALHPIKDIEVDEETVIELLEHGADANFKVDWKDVIRETPYEAARSIRNPRGKEIALRMKDYMRSTRVESG